KVEPNIVSAELDLAALRDGAMSRDGGGLGRKLSIYRLPEAEWSRRLTLEHDVTFAGGADLPVYLRVTQADGHQAWTSPIYLIEWWRDRPSSSAGSFATPRAPSAGR